MVDERSVQANWMFDRGSALHRMLQEVWLGPLGLIMGGWRCPFCGHLHTSDGAEEVTFENAVKAPKACAACKKENRPKWDPFIFVEPWCRNHDLKVRGPCDGILVMPGGALEIFDLKSTSSLSPVRRAPRPAHVRQLHWYMNPHGIKRGRIVYLDPGQPKFEKAMVEHVVEFDSRLMQREKAKVRGLRKALKEEAGPVPACPNGGRSTYGECECVQLEVLWARHGSRSGAKLHGRSDPE
jgi:hypothetical protein